VVELADHRVIMANDERAETQKKKTMMWSWWILTMEKSRQFLAMTLKNRMNKILIVVPGQLAPPMGSPRHRLTAFSGQQQLLMQQELVLVKIYQLLAALLAVPVIMVVHSVP
jgi:hypothetical protein